jgi:hypothetical protein
MNKLNMAFLYCLAVALAVACYAIPPIILLTMLHLDPWLALGVCLAYIGGMFTLTVLGSIVAASWGQHCQSPEIPLVDGNTDKDSTSSDADSSSNDFTALEIR